MTEARTWASMVAGADTTAPAVISDDGVLTRSELFATASGAAGWLDAIDAPPCRVVPALFGSTKEAFALAIAGALTDRPMAPLNPRGTVRELVDQVRGLASDVMVVLPDHVELGTAVAEAAGIRSEVFCELPRSAVSLRWDVAPAAPVIVIHTSGTTGRPKPVTLAEGRLAARAERFADLVRFGPGCVFTSGSPFHHIAGAGIFLTALACGASIAEFPRFSEQAWTRIGALDVTHALLVPTMIERLLDAGRLGLPGLRSLQYGASPIRPETVRALSKELPHVRLTQIYGQTEGSPLTALTHEQHIFAAHSAPELLGSVGTAVPGVELRVEHPDHRGAGELSARASHLFAADDEGWLHTGDLGRIDDDGYVFLLGRKGDMIIRGGENIYPLEVERVIEEHPDVREVAIVGVPDEVLGERVKAVVVLSAGASVQAEALRAHTREALSGYKVPAEWEFVNELPRNDAGKVVRARLR